MKPNNASTETAKLTRYDITDRGELLEREYGAWVDAQEAMLLVEQLQDLCRKYKGIAGACLSGTDEIERIAAESAHHFEAFDKAMAIHRKRDDDLIASHVRRNRLAPRCSGMDHRKDE